MDGGREPLPQEEGIKMSLRRWVWERLSGRGLERRGWEGEGDEERSEHRDKVEGGL